MHETHAFLMVALVRMQDAECTSTMKMPAFFMVISIVEADIAKQHCTRKLYKLTSLHAITI